MRPVSEKFSVSNPYGRPGNYAAKVHTGVDFACPTGTPVRAPVRGKVTVSEYDATYGNYVVLVNWRRKAFLLAHLSKRTVQVGQRVKHGQVVGFSGDTGNSTGPHLHAEQRHSPYGYWDHEKPTLF
jgi:murein DD-endopeptidase MepM/ murein hydrolase activator NlpD